VSDPVEEFEAALREAQEARSTAEHASATVALIHDGTDRANLHRLAVANAALKAAAYTHGPAILARLRAAEAAAPRWRKATEEDRKLARLGFRFLQIRSYMRSPGEWSPWDLEMTTHLESDDEFKRYWVRDLPDDPPEEPRG